MRDRAYASGPFLALLLDRFSPTWKAALSAADSVPLDGLLGDVPALTGGAAQCGFTPAERAQVVSAASADVERLRTRRAERRQGLLGQSGWRVVIAAGDSPLFPQEFDPLNVHLVAPGEVVHSRYIRLGNAAGTVEVFGRSSLTEAAGAHPLFNGGRALTVSGLATAPAMTEWRHNQHQGGRIDRGVSRRGRTDGWRYADRAAGATALEISPPCSRPVPLRAAR